jgi:hypothetical protein
MPELRNGRADSLHPVAARKKKLPQMHGQKSTIGGMPDSSSGAGRAAA